jgi:hypothetical protein
LPAKNFKVEPGCAHSLAVCALDLRKTQRDSRGHKISVVRHESFQKPLPFCNGHVFCGNRVNRRGGGNDSHGTIRHQCRFVYEAAQNIGRANIQAAIARP